MINFIQTTRPQNCGNQNLEKQSSNSCSTSNSNLNSEIDLLNISRNQINQMNVSTNNANCYEDDDVFSSNNSFNSSIQNYNGKQSDHNSSNSSSSNLDSPSLAQLYRNIISN